MQLESNLESATLVKRYKRFLADIKLASGEIITIHCPNTGSMKNCQTPGSRVWYTVVNKKTRKYPGTWQFIEVNNSEVVGINTGLANKLVVEAIQDRIEFNIFYSSFSISNFKRSVLGCIETKFSNRSTVGKGLTRSTTSTFFL